jgi:nucleoside-diphosphate-sugar epimerase
MCCSPEEPDLFGSHVSEALLRRGVQLSVVDSLDDFYSPAAKRTNLEEVRKVGDFCFCELDLCDFDALHQAISKLRPDTIIHLAARAGVRPSIENPYFASLCSRAVQKGLKLLHLDDIGNRFGSPYLISVSRKLNDAPQP